MLERMAMKTRLSTPSTTSSAIRVNRATHAAGSASSARISMAVTLPSWQRTGKQRSAGNGGKNGGTGRNVTLARGWNSVILNLFALAVFFV